MDRRFGFAAAALLLALAAVTAAIRPSAVAPVAPVAPVGPVAPLATPAAITSSPAPEPTTRPIPEGYRVQVPRLGIDLPIAEGIVDRDVGDQKTPEGAAFHFPGTAIPGEGGNTYLYAHARRGMFLALWDARAGDAVVIITPSGVALKFVVKEIHPRVPPEDVSWLEPSPSERLTLQTSTGPNPGDPRFVVIAVPPG